MMSKCSKCNRGLDRGWKFCPYCGTERARFFKFRLPDLFSMVSKELASMDKEFGKDGTFFDAPGMKITVRSGSIQRTKRIRQPIQPKPRSITPKVKVDRVEEPKSISKNIPGGTEMEIRLPGVKSKEDIDIKRVGESLEIRAYHNNTMFFKVIPFPKNSKIASKFEKENLKIKIERV